MNRALLTIIVVTLTAFGAVSARAQECLLPGDAACRPDVRPTIVPANPRPFERLRVQMPRGTVGYPSVEVKHNGVIQAHYRYPPKVEMVGNRIKIVAEMVYPGAEFGGLIMPSPPLDLELGQLPAGSYEVQLLRRMPDGTMVQPGGTTPLTIAPRAGHEPLWNHTDLWWDPNESGWGINLVQRDRGVIFAIWYAYGADGKPTWYAVPNGQWQSPTEYRGTVYRNKGPAATPCVANCSFPPYSNFDPSRVSVREAGVATFLFDPNDSSRAQVTFIIDGATVRRTIRRFAF